MKNTNKIYVLVSLLIGFYLVYFTILDKKLVSTTSEIILTVFWILLCFLSLIMLKYPKDNSLYKKNANKMVIISIMSTLLVSYLLGFFVGFGKNGYIASFDVFIKAVTPILLIKVSRKMNFFLYLCSDLYVKIWTIDICFAV